MAAPAKRLHRLTDLLGHSLAGFMISLVGVLVIDGLGILITGGKFGQMSGWLALVLPVLTFVQQFSAAKGERGRLPVTIVAALAAGAVGLSAAGVFAFLPPVASGAIGALVAMLVYATIWHVSLALLARPQPGSRRP
ncbi:hypothetical protein [Allorhizocola rhizosphaerae]|uniref:hypothetical protein n=1 Tax=Allorhizocola rhizosphaerae TaxID=1872709 RepID=UPI000E3C442A|nr:hypothetical protein [Allorhizocola rhizosphaerae]